MSDHGHLFVIQGDLTRLAADAFLIPCDSTLQVAGIWRPFVEPGATAQPAGQWFRVPGVTLDDGLAVLPDTTPADESAPDRVVGIRVLVDTVGVTGIPEMVERSLKAVELAGERSRARGRRVLPLVALPILGVGQGRFPGRRAEVIRETVEQLERFVKTHAVDVVLCLRRPTDFAAVQWERHRLDDTGTGCWPALRPDLKDLADDLGRKAARGELSVFAGAGVSQPVGLPNWKELLEKLAGRNLEFPDDTDYPALAEDVIGNDRNPEVAALLATERHALGHSLLVGLRTQAMVTTNYDPCFENAAGAIHQDPKLRVMTRQVVVGGSPWLLKLHGDVNRPATIVLTTSQYTRLATDFHALRGVVQSLMLTSHLFFVGFGFSDTDFLAMSTAVKQVRDLADEDLSDPHVGTAISLTRNKRAYPPGLDYRPMRDDDDVPAGARDLEVFLDRLASTCQVEGPGRSSYLLAEDYQQDAAGADARLASTLRDLGKGEAEWSGSAGAKAVRELLLALGLDPLP